jgi:transposase-like protein
MTQKSLYRRHRFSPGAIPHAVSFYVRFSLSLRIVEDLMAHRCIIVSHQKMRLWAEKKWAGILEINPPRPAGCPSADAKTVVLEGPSAQCYGVLQTSFIFGGKAM